MAFRKSMFTWALTGILIGVTALGLTGCSNNSNTAESAAIEATEEDAKTNKHHIRDVSYRTITSGEDWGPAIRQVVLDFGVELDAASIQKSNFKISSIRTYGEMDYETEEVGEPVEHKEERKVLEAYLSDADGKQEESGTCVTLEMEIAPYLEAGSPYQFDMLKYQNDYVTTSYEVSLSAPLSAKDGNPVTMEPTGMEGYKDNRNLQADDYDTSGTYAYNYDSNSRQIDLTYASWFPQKSSEQGKTPLIIWLHGAGEGGTDPNVAILGNKVVNLSTDEIQQYFKDTGAAVLAPQCPTMWLDSSGSSAGTLSMENNTGDSYYTEALMSLITEFVSSHPEIDATRIYLGGCSNGGFMTINLLVRYPGSFAAAFPVCEPYKQDWLTEEKISILADVPMWLTAAKTDSVVNIDDYSNTLYEQLNKAGAADVHYSLFDTVADTSGNYFAEDGSPYEYDGHWSWIYTLNNECKDTIDGREVTLFEWLSGQQGKGEMPQLPLEKEVFPPVSFYMIRHGETEYNRQGLAQGWCDSALTEEGTAMAEELGKGLKDIEFDAVYSSDSKRAVDTCNAVTKNRTMDINITESLREINFGDLEATDSSTLWDDPYHAWTGYDDVGGETYQEVGSRMKKVLDLAAADLPEGGNVLISTHGLSIISILDILCPDDPLYQTLEAGLDNCSVTVLEWNNGAYSLESLNDTTYLNE